MMNARPHPSPLPQERENPFTALEVIARQFVSASVTKVLKVQFAETSVETRQRGCIVLPLLGERAGVRADQIFPTH
jgi:hypothetical protein